MYDWERVKVLRSSAYNDARRAHSAAEVKELVNEGKARALDIYSEWAESQYKRAIEIKVEFRDPLCEVNLQGAYNQKIVQCLS